MTQGVKTACLVMLILSVLMLLTLSPSLAYASTAKVIVSVYMDFGGDGLVAIGNGTPDYQVSGEYEVGSTVEIVAIPADGYTFDRFGRDELTTVSEDAHYTLTVKDGTNNLLAFFEKIPDAFDVVYSGGGGFGFMAPETVKAGGKLILPKCGFIAPLGMEFDYWSVSGTAMKVGDSFTPGDGTTIVANWKPVSSEDWVTISFDSAGGQGTMDSLIVPRGADVFLPECGFSYEGLSFAGWSAGLPGEVIEADQDTVITAIWAEQGLTVSEYTLTITLEGSGLGVGRWVEVTRDGKKMTGEPYTFRQGEEVTIRILSPSEEELAAIDADGISFSPVLKSGDYCASFFMPDRDVDLVLSAQPKRCWILFNGGQALGHLDPVVATVGDKMTLPESFASTPGKRVLSGWREVNGTFRGQPGDSYTVQGNVTLQAVWTVEDAHEHSLVKVDAVPATCETAGQEAYWQCSGCGKLFADAEGSKEISAPVAIPAGHDWGEWTITKEPTSTTEGEKTRMCKRDASHVETEAIPVVTTPGEYVLASGANQTWSADGEEGLTFVIKRAQDDDTTYAHFMGAAVDGVAVPPLGYDTASGSLVLTLKPAYLASLAPGNHMLTFTFDDGAIDVLFETTEAAGDVVPGRSGLPVWAWILIGLGGLAVIAFAALAVLRLRAKKEVAALRASHHIAHEHEGSGSHRR